MKVIRRDLPGEFEEILLYAIADLHWADPNSNHKRIMEDIAYIRDTPNVYCVLNGVLMNCAIKSSISDCYSETLSPMEELKKCVEIFWPIRDKIVCVVPGNHERRHYKTNGIDITLLMCQQLGIEDRYSPTTALVFLRFGKDQFHNHHGRPILYTVFVTHGNGGGRKDGGKIQRLADYALTVDADVYIAGHAHLEAGFKKGFWRPNPANSSVTHTLHLFINTCAELDPGGYGEVEGYDPPWCDRPIIHLSGTKKEMWARI